MASQMVTLRVVEPPMSELLTQLQRARPMELSTADVILMCDDGFVPVHSVVLRQASTFFSDLLTDYFQENTRCGIVRVLLPDYKAVVVQKVIQVLYSGVVDVEDSDDISLDDVREITDAFKMTDSMTYSPIVRRDQYLPILYYERERKRNYTIIDNGQVGDADDPSEEEHRRFNVIQEIKREGDINESSTEENPEEQARVSVVSEKLTKQRKNTEKKNTNDSNQQPTLREKNGRQGKKTTDDEGTEELFTPPSRSRPSSPPAKRALRPRTPLKAKAQKKPNRGMPIRKAANLKPSSKQVYTSESLEMEPETDTGDDESEEVMPKRRRTRTFRSKRAAASAPKKAPPTRGRVTLLSCFQSVGAKTPTQSVGPKRTEEQVQAKKRSATATGNIRKFARVRTISDSESSKDGTDEDNNDNDNGNDNGDAEYVSSGDGDNDDSDYANKKHAEFMEAAKKCNKCGKTYDSPREASVCVTEKHKMVRCYYCFKVLQNTEKLFEHYENGHKKAGKQGHLLCKFCQQVVSFKSVSTHVISNHLFDKNKKPNGRTPSTSTTGTGRPGRSPTIATANANSKTNANKRMPVETSSENEEDSDNSDSDEDEALMGGGKLVVRRNTSSGKKKYKMGLNR